MRTCVLFWLFPVLVGCSRPSAPTPTPAPAPPPECTAQTKLVPGVPGSPGHFIPSPLRTEGVSELASLMRTMEAELGAARASIEAGTPVAPLLPRHRKIRCAWPTDLADRNATFDTNAVVYLAAVAALDARPANPRQAYEGVIAGCLGCHAQSCPGPIVAIEKLRLTAR